MLWPRQALVCLLSFSVGIAQELPALELRVVEGSGMTVPPGVISARRIAVDVLDANGKAVAGATVTFRLPPGGEAGRFASGLTMESTLTGTDGRASVYGIQWGVRPGAVEVTVVSSSAGRRAQIAIPVEISAQAKLTGADRSVAELRETGRSAKIWFIVAGVAGGALAGLAMMGRGSAPAPAAITMPPVVPPSIGQPAISVGRPR